MNAFQISSLITSILSFAFGFFIFFNNRKSRLSRAWFYASLSISVWSLALFGVVSATHERSALLWQYLLDAAATLIPIFYFYFILTFLNLDEKKKFAKNIAKIFGAIFFLLSFTPLIKLGVTKLFLGFYWVEPGPFYLLYLAYFSFFVAYALYLQLKIYRISTGSFRNQIAFNLVAEIVGFGGGLTNFYPVFFNVFPLGNYLVAFYIVFMSYAIIRHGFFDLRIIATEIFSVLLAIALLVDFLASQTLGDYLLRGILFFGTLIFSYFLIRSVFREVRQREKIERLAKDLETANAELKRLDEAKSEFISLASHQLRAPLTVIKGYTSMVMEGTFGEISKKVSEALNRVFISANNLTKLVSELLDLSRIESGRIKYEFKDIYLEDVVEKVLKELEEVSKAKRIAIEFKNENKKTFSVFGDADKLYEVVMNLLDNALKYSTASPIAVVLKPRSKRLALSVADKGLGIPKDEMSKLFIKFGRTEIAQKEQPGGMGLGLYFVKKIVEDHKGRIWVESPGLGKGSTFFVELPAK
ncbi:MAG: ATP-binding protein [Candidatus Giovannonibacteria bacterium]|nr:ATP-binding protein [Candidatus Giovannonibacteria bacterium]